MHSPYLTGDASGENRVVEQEARLLEAAGHSVRTFLPARRASRRLGGGREALSAVWSGDAVRRSGRSIARDSAGRRPLPQPLPGALTGRSAGSRRRGLGRRDDAAQLPAPLPACDASCATARVCELCLGRQPWRGVVHRCYRGSLGGSAALGTSLVVHRALGSLRARAALSRRERLRPEEARRGGLPRRADRTSSRTSSRKPCGASGAGDLSLCRPSRGREGRRHAGRGCTCRRDASRRRGLRDRTRIGSVTGALPTSPSKASCRSNVSRPFCPPRARSFSPPLLRGGASERPRGVRAGVPVIANRLGALPELVAHGETGLLVEPGDVDDLASALRRLSDDAESERMGLCARSAWEARYSPEHGLAGLERAYAAALAAPRSP